MRERLHEWTRDLRHATRALGRNPGFTVMAVGTLSLAIGANAGMFSVVNKVLLDPRPYAHADRLVHIEASAPGSDMPPVFGVAAEFFIQYKEQARLLEDVSIYNSFASTLRAGDRVERIRVSAPTTSLFTTLGVSPLIGRLPVAADDDGVAVISHALWMSWFGGDHGVLGTDLFNRRQGPHDCRRDAAGVPVSRGWHAALDFQHHSLRRHRPRTIRRAARGAHGARRDARASAVRRGRMDPRAAA